MPTISVIVPVYKAEPYLRRCVDSILAQSFRDFELILVDDGSPDGCPAICDAYAEKDTRVQVIHQENGGLSAARNAGIDWVFEKSDSEWISFVDSDDWIHPEMLERLYQAVTENHRSVSICGYVETDGEPIESENHSSAAELWHPEPFYVQEKGAATVAWGKLYRKACFDTLRYPQGKIHEDEFTTYKILFSQQQILFIRKPLYYYFQNSNGIMHSNWAPKRLQVLEALHEQLQFFEDNGYVDARKKAAQSYLWILVGALSELEKLHPQYSEYAKFVKQKLRQSLKRYHKCLNLSVQGNEWIYESAYPIQMKIYWWIIAIKNRLK